MDLSSDFWRGRRVLVTGATGIVGSWLVKELLTREATVAALVLDADPQSELYRSGDVGRVTVVNGDLRDFWTLERAVNVHEPDSVFHLGAQTLVGVAHRFPLPTLDTNVRGTYNLLEACRIHAGLVNRIVVASSDKAYGQTARLPSAEDEPLVGRHPYEVSKSCADLIAQAYHHTYGIPVAIARCGNVYGGGDLNWSRLVPGTIRSLLRDERPVLRSDGTYVRDYLYVKDAVRSYLLLAERLDDERVRGGAFNFSAESPLSALEMVSEIGRVMGRNGSAPEILASAVGEIPHQALSAAKAKSILGWEPDYDLESGLRETIGWYRELLG